MTDTIQTTNQDEENALRVLVDRFARPHSRGFLVGIAALVLARLPQRIPALLIGVSLDALFLATQPYRIPLVPTGWIPETTTGQIWFTVGILAGAVLLETAAPSRSR